MASLFLLALGVHVSEAGQDADALEREIQTCVADLAETFLNGEPMDGFPYVIAEPEAYRWQDAFLEAMRPSLGTIAGYKAGGVRPGARIPTFPRHGLRGAFLEGMILPTGSTIDPDATTWGFLESDLAVRVGNRSINSAVTDLELLAGLDAVVPLVEVPDPAYKPLARSPTSNIVTNNGTRFAVVGAPIPLEATEAWSQRLRSFTFAVHDENGNELGSGSITDRYEPLDVVRWLRDQLRSTGHELQPGQILSLGGIGIQRQLKAGSARGGPAYDAAAFTVSYYGLSERPATVSVRLKR